jgi:hypothetical protein
LISRSNSTLANARTRTPKIWCTSTGLRFILASSSPASSTLARISVAFDGREMDIHREFGPVDEVSDLAYADVAGKDS